MSETLTPTFSPTIDFKVEINHLEEKTTIVHCILKQASFIRIWPDTYLIQENGTKKHLLHAYNIAPYPNWRIAFEGHRFTLVFEGLENGCRSFSLIENIPEPNGFCFSNILRNHTDIYRLDVLLEV